MNQRQKWFRTYCVQCIWACDADNKVNVTLCHQSGAPHSLHVSKSTSMMLQLSFSALNHNNLSLSSSGIHFYSQETCVLWFRTIVLLIPKRVIQEWTRRTHHWIQWNPLVEIIKSNAVAITGDMLKFSETQKLQNMLKQCHILSKLRQEMLNIIKVTRLGFEPSVMTWSLGWGSDDSSEGGRTRYG